MISAASERLHQYKMDVIFVVYPAKTDENDVEDEDECYQVIIFNKKGFYFYFFK